jgi:exopolysaccharide biosynthesis polyprenyl glycosylphosphotransferase
MALTTYMVFWQENFASRFIILFTWIFSILFVTTGRLLLRFARQYFRTKGLGVYRTLLIGNTSVAETLKQTYATKPQLGIDVIAHIPAGENILFDIKKYNVDQVIQADSSLSRTISAELIDYCQREHIIYQYVGGNFESKVTNNEVFTIVGIPMIELKRTPLDGWGKILKRVLDIVGALFCIVLFSPIMIITAIAVKLTSKGPIIADVPPRAGQFHRPFEMFKFRSMYVGSHAKQKELVSDREGLFKMQDDPRLTSIGKFIRKTSIDELPQFFNVIIGNMSLVGPRPHFLNEYTPEQLRVLDIKPGITGLAQISGRSDLAFEDEIKLDLSYIENWSLWLDSWILLKTPIILFTKMKSAV